MTVNNFVEVCVSETGNAIRRRNGPNKSANSQTNLRPFPARYRKSHDSTVTQTFTGSQPAARKLFILLRRRSESNRRIKVLQSQLRHYAEVKTFSPTTPRPRSPARARAFTGLRRAFDRRAPRLFYACITGVTEQVAGGRRELPPI